MSLEVDIETKGIQLRKIQSDYDQKLLIFFIKRNFFIKEDFLSEKKSS